MPQYDRYKNFREVPIEFAANETFEDLPLSDRRILILLTNGSLSGTLNGRPIAVAAPGALCLSIGDQLRLDSIREAAAQSFRFHPDFLYSVRVAETENVLATNLRIQTGMSLFDRGRADGIPVLSESAYPKLFEWFFVMGMEVHAQSDALWACRIKKYLIQILGMLEDLHDHGQRLPVDLVLDYIHMNYSDKITLEELTVCARLNRVSLNKLFRERCGCTAMGYLLSHRLKVAEDLLLHTDMNLNDIARSTGFTYDTYFIKQFSLKKGLSPTAFRQAARTFAVRQ